VIRLEGLTGVLESLAKHEEKVVGAGVAGVTLAAERVQEAWINNIIGDDLVLTGHYRDSIKVHPDGLEAIVRSDDTPYADILEFGDSRQAAHYPATRAADESHEEIINAVAETVGKVL